MKKRSVAVLLPMGALILLLWAPWISHSSAEARTSTAFEAAWRNVADGCGFNCQGCGILGSERTLGGVLVAFEYACGLLPFDSPEFHSTGTAFVSFLGTVSGLPKP